MALSGDFSRLKQMAREIEQLGRTGSAAQKIVTKPIARKLELQIKQQFATGTGPDGGAQVPTRRGKPGLVSRRLPGTIRITLEGAGLLGRSKVDWLFTHQAGYTFAARKGGGQVLVFDRRGRLLSARRARRAKFVFDRSAGAHTIGARVLPPRPIYPEAGMTGPWASAINEGATEGMTAWAERATR